MKVILINFLWTFFGIHCICNNCCECIKYIDTYVHKLENMYINLYIYQCIWIWWMTVTLHGDFLWLMLYKIDLCLYCKDVLFCNKKKINYLEKKMKNRQNIYCNLLYNHRINLKVLFLIFYLIYFCPDKWFFLIC